MENTAQKGRPGRKQLAGSMERVTLDIPTVLRQALDDECEARIDRPPRSVLIRQILAEAVLPNAT